MEKSLVPHGEEALGAFTPQRLGGRKQSAQNMAPAALFLALVFSDPFVCGEETHGCLPHKNRDKD